MTVRKIKGEWYVDTYVKRPGKAPQRLRKRAPVQTKRDAEAYERSLLQDVYGLSDRPPRTFEEFVRNDFAAYIQAHNRVSEEQSKESILRMHLVPFFGNSLLSEIGAKQVEIYAAEKARDGGRGRGLSAKSINNHLTVLRKCLTLAHQYGDLDKVPAVKWRKVPQQKFRFLSFAEADRMIAAAEPGLWRAMVIVALRTGMRRGELFGLQWEDVDLDARRVQVVRAIVRDHEAPTKNGKVRTIPLTHEAVEAIRSVKNDTPLVFQIDGKAITRNLSKWPLWRACKAAKIEPHQWHALRHSFASHLAMRGVSMRVIMDLLGHGTMTMTLRYAHLSPSSLSDAVALLDGPHSGTTKTQQAGKGSNNGTLRERGHGFDSRCLHRNSPRITRS